MLERDIVKRFSLAVTTHYCLIIEISFFYTYCGGWATHFSHTNKPRGNVLATKLDPEKKMVRILEKVCDLDSVIDLLAKVHDLDHEKPPSNISRML